MSKNDKTELNHAMSVFWKPDIDEMYVDSLPGTSMLENIAFLNRAGFILTERIKQLNNVVAAANKLEVVGSDFLDPAVHRDDFNRLKSALKKLE